MMIEYKNDNPAEALAPANIYGRSDEEEFVSPSWRNRDKKASKCPVYFLLLLTILSILIFIFANVVLRIEAPQVTLNSVTVTRLSNLTESTASISGTLLAEIDIENNNFGYFKYSSSSIAFLYENVTLGVANITGGRVFARETGTVNVTVDVKSTYSLDQNPNFISNLSSSGVLELRSFAMIVGTVHIRKSLTWRRSHLMNCTMSLFLNSTAIQDLRCL